MTDNGRATWVAAGDVRVGDRLDDALVVAVEPIADAPGCVQIRTTDGVVLADGAAGVAVRRDWPGFAIVAAGVIVSLHVESVPLWTPHQCCVRLTRAHAVGDRVAYDATGREIA